MVKEKLEVSNEVIDGVMHYHIEKLLAQKLYRMAVRISDDSDQNGYIINHGMTGSGKTNSSIVEAHFVKQLTGRDIYMFFRLEDLIQFAKTHREKIIIWDEPAFTSLSTDVMSKLNKDLFRLINTSRLKRHLIIINFTKFWRFSSDILTDTAQFMIHMNNSDKKKGRFLYLPQEKLDDLWMDWTKYRQKNYSKYKTFGGKMPFIYKKWFSECHITIDGKPDCTYEDYLDLRDKSVMKIGGGDKGKDKWQVKLEDFRDKVARITEVLDITQQDLAKALKISPARLREWKKINEKGPVSLGKSDFEDDSDDTYLNMMDEVPGKIQKVQDVPPGQLNNYNKPLITYQKGPLDPQTN